MSSYFKNYVCPICDIRYGRIDSYKNHMYTHTNLSFECSECKKTFSRPKVLTDHMAQVHLKYRRSSKQQEERNDALRQTILAKVEAQEQQAKQNVTKPNEKKVTKRGNESSGKSIKCPICKESFASRTGFELHVYLHLPRTVSFLIILI